MKYSGFVIGAWLYVLGSVLLSESGASEGNIAFATGLTFLFMCILCCELYERRSSSSEQQ